MQGGVRKRGGTWSYYFDCGSVQGKRQKKEKGGFSSRKEAEAALSDAVSRYNKSGNIFTPSEITVSDFLDEWLRQYVKENLSYHTWQAYVSLVNNHIRPQLGAYRLRSLTAASLQEYTINLKNSGLTKATVYGILVVLKSALDYAVVPLQYIDSNPARLVRLPKMEKNPPTRCRYMDKGQIEKLFEMFPFGAEEHLLFALGYYCGMRVNECLSLTWDKIDLDNGVIHVDRQIIGHAKPHFLVFGKPKSESSIRDIAIGKTLIRELRRERKRQKVNYMKAGPDFYEYYMDSDDHIKSCRRKNLPDGSNIIEFVCIRDDGFRISSSRLTPIMKQISEELGITFCFHTLRHTHATVLVENKADIKDVQARLGHASVKTTINTYVADTDKMKKRTVDIFEQASGGGIL